MIAEVGDIENVSGSRIATPLAPPRPGSTPMTTPSRMPTIITPILNGCRTVAKPCIKLAISSISLPSLNAYAAVLTLRARALPRYSPSQYSTGPLGSAIWK